MVLPLTGSVAEEVLLFQALREGTHVSAGMDDRNIGGRSRGGLLFNCRLTASVGAQGRDRTARLERLATRRQIGQHIAPLLLPARDHRQDMGDKPAALLTLRAVAALAPLHGMP